MEGGWEGNCVEVVREFLGDGCGRTTENETKEGMECHDGLLRADSDGNSSWFHDLPTTGASLF